MAGIVILDQQALRRGWKFKSSLINCLDAYLSYSEQYVRLTLLSQVSSIRQNFARRVGTRPSIPQIKSSCRSQQQVLSYGAVLLRVYLTFGALDFLIRARHGLDGPSRKGAEH
jgi:hypothetical protein